MTTTSLLDESRAQKVGHDDLGRYGALFSLLAMRERFSWSINGDPGREVTFCRSAPSMWREKRLSMREVAGAVRVVESTARGEPEEGGVCVWALPSSVARDSC